MTKYALGALPDVHDDRDYRFSRVANQLGLFDLPRQIDLTHLCSPIKDQGQLGECTGEALTGGREMLLNRDGKPLVILSAMGLYQRELIREHHFGQDVGAMPRDGLIELLNRGCLPESVWPSDPAKFTTRPPDDEVVAHPFKITEFHRINNLIELKQALTITRAVPISILVAESFMSDDVARTGIVPLPGDPTVDPIEGGHAVLCVGYDDAVQQFIVRNSWGAAWGQEGYFRLPYGYFLPQRELTIDLRSFNA